MTPFEPVTFAWMGADYDQVGKTLVNVLAVAGGGLIGALGSWIGTHVLTRLMYAGSPPKWVGRGVGGAGGVIGGWIVYALLFATGGGPGPGPGMGPGQGGQPGLGGTTAPARTEPDAGPRQTGKQPPDSGAAVKVTVVTGTDKRNYKLPDEPGPVTLGEATKRVGEKPDLKRLEIVLYDDSPDRDTEAVRDLQTWAKARGLTVSVTDVPGKAP
jgi:hypothetical protein